MRSIALQYGVPAEAISHAIGRNSDGSTAGPLGKLLDFSRKGLQNELMRPLSAIGCVRKAAA
jgi:hypothetical protein